MGKLDLLAESILTAWPNDYLAAERNNDTEQMEHLINWAKNGESCLWAKIVRMAGLVR